MSPTALAQARDVNTSADVLRRLSRGGDPHVLAAVVANPNVPPDLLWALAERFPDELFLNPSLELLSLEDPLWLQRPPVRVVAQLVVHPRAPEWFVDQVLSGPLSVRIDLAGRLNRPDLLWRLAQKAGSSKKLLERLITNLFIPVALLEHLAVEHDLMGKVLRYGKHQPTYFIDAAFEAGRFEGFAGQQELARLYNVPAHHLERMVASPHEPVRWAVTQSPSLSKEMLVRLARDPSPRVRAQVALHVRCPKPLAQEIRQALPLRPRPLPLEP